MLKSITGIRLFYLLSNSGRFTFLDEVGQTKRVIAKKVQDGIGLIE